MPLRAFSSASPPTIRDKLFINNEWVASAKTFPVENPATCEEFFQCAAASEDHVNSAAVAARAALRSDGWKNTTGTQRAEILRKMSAALRAQKEDFAILETMDNGKPLNESRADMDFCADAFGYFADLGEQLDGSGHIASTIDVKSTDPDFKVQLKKEPSGVIGMVTPWNFPLMQAVAKVAPAIAAGCTMVLKPSSVCPATCLRLGDLALEAGLPAGVLNVITGTGREAGNALLNHPGMDRLSFTGSSATGHMVLNAAAKRLIPSCVELGGKGAIVVFDDVDIEATVDWIMVGIFVCSGQVCSATSRLVLQDTIYDKLMARLREETAKIKIGDPLDDNTQMGPIVSKEQLHDIMGFLKRAEKSGGTVTCGGKLVHPEGFPKGHFMEPTIIEDPDVQSEIWREEVFGPVLAVRRFSTEAEAVELANDSPYGLGSAVCTADSAKCARVAAEINAGVVWQNCANALPVSAPFGGFGQSGFGKEYGELGLEDYLRVKSVISCGPKFTWNWYIPKK